MPTLDVSDLLTDDLFTETVTVLRREQIIDPATGRTTTNVKPYYNVPASIQPKDTAIGGNFIERGPGGIYRGSNLNIYTGFRLRSVSQEGSAVQYQPDLVIWNGDAFSVALTNDWSHYGAGFMHAELESTEMIDWAPDGLPGSGQCRV
jgi:hypothetical protein